jgi:hypothetical protein
MPGPDEPEPPAFAKMTPGLQRAYSVAYFSGTTQHAVSAANIAVERHRFRLVIQTTKASAAADSALVARHGGNVISQSGRRLEAWIPYHEIPALALDTLVNRIDVVKSGL